MMTRALFFIASILYLSSFCIKPEREFLVLSKNEFDQVIRWNEFPITISFDQSFPDDKKEIFIGQVKELNSLLKFEVIKITSDSKNLIYWSHEFVNPHEQGRTTLSHLQGEVTGVRMTFNPRYDRTTDFATLVRHELTHAIGFASHTEYGLMETHLREGEIKFWDLKLLSAWMKDMDRESSTLVGKKDN